MKNILFFLMNLLLALGITGIITPPLYAAQPQAVRGRCWTDQAESKTGLRHLTNNKHVTLTLSAGQRVMLSNKAEATGLTTTGAIALQARESGEYFRFTGTSTATQDVTQLFTIGEETTIAVTAPEGESFWLIIFNPCAAQKPAAGTVQDAGGPVADSQLPALDPGQPIVVATVQRVAILPTATSTTLPTATPLPSATMTPMTAAVALGQANSDPALHSTPDTSAAGQSREATQPPRLTTFILTAFTGTALLIRHARIALTFVGLLILLVGAAYLGWQHRHSPAPAALKAWVAQTRAASQKIMGRFITRLNR